MADPVPTLSEEERTDVLRHLGYSVTARAASIQLGIQATSQTSFLVLQAMNLLLPSSLATVRQHLVRLNEIDKKIFEASDRLAAKKVGEIDLNPDEPDLLEREYRRWAMRLSDILGAPLNAYSERFRGQSINVPVIH